MVFWQWYSYCILRWIKKKSIDYWVNTSILHYYNEIEVLFLTNSNVSFLQFHLMHFIEYQWKRAKKCKCIDTFVFSFSQTTLVLYLVLLNHHWHELGKQEKCSSLELPRGIFYKTQWAWQGVKLTKLMSIFTSKKVWKFLIKIQLTKFDPKW